jgi:hypothetical protein
MFFFVQLSCQRRMMDQVWQLAALWQCAMEAAVV